MNNNKPALTVYADGSIEVAPGLTLGGLLQLLDTVRAGVLNMPLRAAPPKETGNETDHPPSVA